MNLDEFKKDNNILIIGHCQPDIDAIVSAKILSEIFKHHGINTKYAILENDSLSNNKIPMVNDCMKYNPFVIKNDDINKYHYFLVDHNDVNQSIKKTNLVIGCIDHHVNNNTIDNAIFVPTCSTALGIYNLFKNDYKFTKKQLKQIYYACIDDTSFGYNPRYKESDKKLIKEMNFDTDLNIYFKKYFKPTNLIDLNDAFNNSEFKIYEFDDIKFKSTYIEALDIKLKQNYKNFIKNNKENFLGMWLDYSKNKTYVFFKYNNNYYETEFDQLADRAVTIINDVLEFIRRNNV